MIIFIMEIWLDILILHLLLMLFNLIPLPPLDGGRIMVGLLPRRFSIPLARVEPYGMMILVVMLMWDPIGLFSGVLWPTLGSLTNLILG